MRPRRAVLKMAFSRPHLAEGEDLPSLSLGFMEGVRLMPWIDSPLIDSQGPPDVGDPREGAPGDLFFMPKNSAENSADAGVCGSKPALTRRSDRFLTGLTSFQSVSFVSHVQPDPDSLGSMVGLAHLIETCLGKPTRLTRDGAICRAENRAMVDLLGIDLAPVEEIDWRPEDAVIMVDSQPKTGRHSFNGEARIWGVIDHHQTPGDLGDIPFLDIRRSIGATCSLVTRYIMEQDLDLPPRVATALYYGIHTELSGYPREASAIDDHALNFLFPRIDQDVLAQIRNAPLPDSFFEALLHALQSSFIYDRLLISWINDLESPELVAQVVDHLVRHEGINWAVCAGVHQEKMYLSLRTNQPRAHAGEILRQVTAKMGGRAGGHDRRAGGFIPLLRTAASAIENVQGELRRGLLKALDIEETRGRRLVPPREMLQNMV
jgi:nanoRNase/pAp phosphatase (c-di-AMP/oligoRNAs hydrolase)